MKLFTRMVLILVLAVFAAGSVVRAAGAAAASDMIMAETLNLGSADRDACGDETETLTATCDLVCSAGGFAVVPVSGALEVMLTLRDLRQRSGDIKLSSFSILPLREPPRPIL